MWNAIQELDSALAIPPALNINIPPPPKKNSSCPTHPGAASGSEFSGFSGVEAASAIPGLSQSVLLGGKISFVENTDGAFNENGALTAGTGAALGMFAGVGYTTGPELGIGMAYMSILTPDVLGGPGFYGQVEVFSNGTVSMSMGLGVSAGDFVGISPVSLETTVASAGKNSCQ